LQLGKPPGHTHGPLLKIEIIGTQRNYLAPTQTGEGREEHDGAIPPLDQFGQRYHRGDRSDRPLGCFLLVVPTHPARVLGEQSILIHSRVEHSAE
jgi:hypothetical protein